MCPGPDRQRPNFHQHQHQHQLVNQVRRTSCFEEQGEEVAKYNQPSIQGSGAKCRPHSLSSLIVLLALHQHFNIHVILDKHIHVSINVDEVSLCSRV